MLTTNAIHKCNVCGSIKCAPYIDLGDFPIAHHLSATVDKKEYRHPFRLVLCSHCGLLQIADGVPPEKLYADTDLYLTSFQKPQHLDDLITTAVTYQDPGSVLDIGCNDGYLFEFLQKQGYENPIGLEPNATAVKIASALGYHVHKGMLTNATAKQLVAEHGLFDAVYLRHVLEHCPNLEECFSSIHLLLKPGGQLVCELPQVEHGLQQGNPAFLWEEHVNYFTEPFAEKLLTLYGFEIQDKRRYVFGGGSIAFIAKKNIYPQKPDFASLRPLGHEPLVLQFPEKLKLYRTALNALLQKARAQGYTIVIYGAAPRSCSIVNGCGIASYLDFVIDDRGGIQNLIMPGTDKAVQPRAIVLPKLGNKCLCLLGVGADKESIVLKKMSNEYDGTLVCVSLFPQRDTVASIQQADVRITHTGPQALHIAAM